MKYRYLGRTGVQVAVTSLPGSRQKCVAMAEPIPARLHRPRYRRVGRI